MERIFKCRNGHEYESKKPITTSWAERRFGLKANDKCKICGAQIVSEIDYNNGKAVMGAVRLYNGKEGKSSKEV